MKMHYYKDADNNRVHAYSDEQLAQVNRCTELEALLVDKELELTESQKKLKEKQDSFNAAYAEYASNSDNTEDELNSLQEKAIRAQDELANELASFKEVESGYMQLKLEYDSILQVFFDIRDNLKVFKKMTDKEVKEYTNPPISKEQHIAEAEAKKQSLLVEAAKGIAPLQDAVDLDMATSEESALLKEWKKYRVLLNRVDTSTAPDIEFPEKPAK